MSSCCGLTGRPVEANYTPLSKLVEGRVCLDVHMIEREGFLVEGAEGTLQIPTRNGDVITAGNQHSLQVNGKFRIGDQGISTRPHRRLACRLWCCCRCDRDCRFLFLGDDGIWACRGCVLAGGSQ